MSDTAIVQVADDVYTVTTVEDVVSVTAPQDVVTAAVAEAPFIPHSHTEHPHLVFSASRPTDPSPGTIWVPTT